MRHLFAICKKTDIYLGKKYFFVCTILPSLGQNMVIVMKWMFFLGPKTRFSDQKFVFYHRTLIFVNGPFVALGETVHFAPWDWFFNFSFQSYGRFRKKKRPTHQKVFPHPNMRALSATNSPSPSPSPSGLDNFLPTPLWGHCLPVTALALDLAPAGWIIFPPPHCEGTVCH